MGRLYANIMPFYIRDFCIHGFWYLWEYWNQSISVSGEREKYWVGQKVASGFSITSYGKPRTNFLANTIYTC